MLKRYISLNTFEVIFVLNLVSKAMEFQRLTFEIEHQIAGTMTSLNDQASSVGFQMRIFVASQSFFSPYFPAASSPQMPKKSKTTFSLCYYQIQSTQSRTQTRAVCAHTRLSAALREHFHVTFILKRVE